MSWVVDPPGTKGGPRAGNFLGPPKNTFCPGWSHDLGQKTLLSRVVASPRTKDPPNISSFFLRLPPTLSVLDLRPLPPPSPAPTASCSPPSSSSSAAYLRRKRTRRPSSAAPPRGIVPERRRPRLSPSPRAPSSAIAGPRPRAPCPPRARHRPPPPHPDAVRRHVVVLLPDLRLRPGCLARASAVACAPPGRPAVACAHSRCTCAARRPGPAGSPAVRCRSAPPPNPNVYFLVKFENMDYMSSNLFTNYVVTY